MEGSGGVPQGANFSLHFFKDIVDSKANMQMANEEIETLSRKANMKRSLGASVHFTCALQN